MQVRGNSVITWFFVPCEIIRVDELNRTELVYNNEAVDLTGPFPRLRAGDTIELLIPSGELEVTVEAVTTDGYDRLVTVGPFRWAGKYAGLVGGLSGLATWTIKVADDAEVTTSAWDEPVPWRVYLQARETVNKAEEVLLTHLSPEGYRKALSWQIFQLMPPPDDADTNEVIELDLDLGEAEAV